MAVSFRVVEFTGTVPPTPVFSGEWLDAHTWCPHSLRWLEPVLDPEADYGTPTSETRTVGPSSSGSVYIYCVSDAENDCMVLHVLVQYLFAMFSLKSLSIFPI